MPDPAGTYNDGGLQWGTPLIECLDSAGDAATYVADSFNIDRGSRTIGPRLNEYGVPTGKVHIREYWKGSATLQFNAADTKLPGYFSEFTFEIDGEDVTFIITKIGKQFGNSSETKIPVEIEEKIGS